LPSLPKSISFPKILINIFQADQRSTLISHNQSTNTILIKWLGNKRCPMSSLKMRFTFILYFLFLLVLDLLHDLL
jgi:hypothetical protein